VIVRLNEGYCAALTNIGTLKILPEHIHGASTPSPSNGAGDGGANSPSTDQFVGSGPLILQAWNADSITFVPNPNYWNGTPTINNWTYRIFSSAADAEAALNSGDADVLDRENARPIRTSLPAGVKTFTRTANQFYSLAINLERDIFKDARVRQALASALDRPRLAQDLFNRDAKVMQTSLLPAFWSDSASATQPAYDPARARQLLTDAGWRDSDGDGILDKDGKPLNITLWAVADDPVDEPLAFEARSMLAQSGFQVLLQLDDRDELLTRLFLHQFDLAIAPWNIPLDPDQHWYWQSTENKQGEGLNFVSYSNPQVDDLMKRGNAAAKCDSSARRTVYAQAFRTIASDVPQVFLFAPPAYLDTRARVYGVSPSSFAGDYWNLNSWEVAPQ
jgi:peptide/nickel transport system substrate-binding protein